MPMLVKQALVKQAKLLKLVRLVRPNNRKRRPTRKLGRRPPIKVRLVKRLPRTQL